MPSRRSRSFQLVELRNEELAVAVAERFLVFVETLAQKAHVLGVGGRHLKQPTHILAAFGRFWQTLDGPFSAVSTATIARIGAFFQLFSRSTRLAHFCSALSAKF